LAPNSRLVQRIIVPRRVFRLEINAGHLKRGATCCILACLLTAVVLNETEKASEADLS
jgi:hypothetical protein